MTMERDSLFARLTALQDFAKWAIREGAFQAADLDGLSIQEKAQELGLIEQTTYDPEKHGPSDCAEDGCEWYVFSPALTEAAAALSRPEQVVPPTSERPTSDALPETQGPYEARLCKGIPTDCCDYGVISLSEGREVCRVWREQDARAIAAALASAPASPAIGIQAVKDGDLIRRIIEQVRVDLKSAHEEICKLQGLDPAKHTWPEWSSPANTLRWFDKIEADLCLTTAAPLQADASAPASPAIGVQAVTDEMVERALTEWFGDPIWRRGCANAVIESAEKTMRAALEAALHPAPEAASAAAVCEDCPPVGYPTDATRCLPCPNRATEAPSPAAAREMVTLAECPVGLFYSGNELCLKTEYGNNEGRIDAYIVSSGEFFWGAKPQTISSQRAQLVRPVTPSSAPSPKGVSDGVREWQPMETAPKDGKHILLCVKSGPFFYAVEGGFYKDQWLAAYVGEVTPVYWAWKPTGFVLPSEAALSQEPVPATAEERAASKEGA